VTSAGLYDISVRVTATAPGKTLSIEMDGVNVSGTINVPNTGGWQTWQTVTIKNVQLSAGTKQLKVLMGSDYINLNNISIVKPVITDLDDIDQNVALKLFPNPSTGILNYVLPNDLNQACKVEVINVLGTVVYQQYNAPASGIINVEFLEAGQYLFKITNFNGVIIRPVMIL
jgi:hypothetical protein